MYTHILLNQQVIHTRNRVFSQKPMIGLPRLIEHCISLKNMGIFLIVSTLLLSGCANMAHISDIFDKSRPKSDPVQKAELLKVEGNYLASANEYLRLARSASPSEKPRYQLGAVQALLKVGMINEAKAELAKVDIAQNRSLESYFQLVEAQVAMAENRTESAALRLQVINPNALPLDLQKLYYELQIQVLESKGDILNAAAQRVQLDNILNAKEKVENRERLWQNLTKVSAQDLQNFFQDNKDVLSGWVALALLYKTTHPKHFQQAIKDWQAHYPNHPALQGTIQNLSNAAASSPSLQTQQIALLLPFQSRRKPYADAIYRGFMAANYAGSGAAKIRVYDVNPNTVAQIYQKALTEGADFVVGPLQKESIDALLSSPVQLRVPTLCLNHSENASPRPNLYQFSLSPEDEAHSIALKMWEDGYRATAVLAPSGPVGERVLNAFQYTWTQRGGRLVMAEFYGKQVENSVNTVLQQNGVFDSVFMVASPKYGRELMAFFKYHNANNFPVYSMSHIYSGEYAPREDAELDSIIFGDMPWRITPSPKAQQLQSNFNMFFPESIPQFSSLYAFGIDAYHLLARITQSANTRFGFQWDGQTGRLAMDSNGMIHRQWIHWAKFANGIPLLLNPNAPRPDDSTIPDAMRQESLIRELGGLPAQ